ncbi:uncharacterized protein GBIM_09318, partial [Gryllus bimaculatus]
MLSQEGSAASAANKGGGGGGGGANPLAAASAYVEVDFSASDLPQRPDFVQNDGGGVGGGAGGGGGLLGAAHGGRDRKAHRDMPPGLQDILIGIPLKDENNHEPTVQARQHRSGQAAAAAAAGGLGSGVGARHRGPALHMTPLEIGMYVLLAAFCFAIVVFVVSCVVYASKVRPPPPQTFKPQVALESPAALASGGPATWRRPPLGRAAWAAGSRAAPPPPRRAPAAPRAARRAARAPAARARAVHHRPPTGVVAGPAPRLERASGHGHSHGHGQQPGPAAAGAAHLHHHHHHHNNNNNNNNNNKEMRITANPMLGYGGEGGLLSEAEAAALGNCFDNPTHIELPAALPAPPRAALAPRALRAAHRQRPPTASKDKAAPTTPPPGAQRTRAAGLSARGAPPRCSRADADRVAAAAAAAAGAGQTI